MAPKDVDTTVAHTATVHGYWMGSKDHFTASWEAAERGDERLPERLRRLDLGTGFRAAGFIDVEVTDRPHWLACERSVWQEAVALDPGGDPALRSFHDEGVRSLEYSSAIRRVMASATAP